MKDDKNKPGATTTQEEENAHKPDVHNPLNNENDKEITEDDVENEQMFKEAQTERD